MSYALLPVRAGSAPAGSRISGFGAAQPSGTLTGDELGARIGRTAEWIEERTGIRQIRKLDSRERILDLALAAAREALTPNQSDDQVVDLVIASTCSRKPGERNFADQIADVVAPRAGRMELNAACAGFCYGVATADALIRTGAASRVLLVAAEHMTSVVDPADLGTSIIFGAGAGSAAIEASHTVSGVGPVAWGSDGAGADLIAMSTDTRMLTMQGRRVFRWAVESMHGVAMRACTLAGVCLAEIDVFVPHQANKRIIDALVTKLGLQDALTSRDIATSGNTSAASIPIAITKLLRVDEAKPGRLALIIGFGAGLTYAAQVIRLP